MTRLNDPTINSLKALKGSEITLIESDGKTNSTPISAIATYAIEKHKDETTPHPDLAQAIEILSQGKQDKRAREVITIDLGEVAPQEIVTASINLGRSFKLLRAETTASCWMRLYSRQIHLAADAARIQTNLIMPGNGLISEVNFDQGIFEIDLDNTHGSSMEVTGAVALSVKNTKPKIEVSGLRQAAMITLTFHYLKLED